MYNAMILFQIQTRMSCGPCFARSFDRKVAFETIHESSIFARTSPASDDCVIVAFLGAAPLFIVPHCVYTAPIVCPCKQTELYTILLVGLEMRKTTSRYEPLQESLHERHHNVISQDVTTTFVVPEHLTSTEVMCCGELCVERSSYPNRNRRFPVCR